MSWLSQLSRSRLFGALFAVIAVVLGLIVATAVSARNVSPSEPLYLEQAADARHKQFVPVAKAAAKPKYVGAAWPRFKPPTVVVVEKRDAPRPDRVVERERAIERDLLVPVGQVDGPCAPGYYRADDGSCYLLPPPPDANNPAPVTNPVIACLDGSAPQQGNCPIVVVPDPQPDPNQAPVDPATLTPDANGQLGDPRAVLEQSLRGLREHEAAGHLTPEQIAWLREMERQASGGSPAPQPAPTAPCPPGSPLAGTPLCNTVPSPGSMCQPGQAPAPGHHVRL